MKSVVFLVAVRLPAQRRSAPPVALPLAALLLCGACACASFPVNRPLAHYDPAVGYRFKNLAVAPTNGDETFVILTLSGGGTRAAAFAYGVMRGLERAAIAGSPARSLLDEVDVISSVSGGSFAAAYYGAFGKDEFFARFPTQVLERNIESGLVLQALAPWNWPRLLSYRFARSDLAGEYYDRQIFKGKTFGALPLRRPQIILNATDLSLGAQFSFTQDHFDRLCSDLSKVKIARGVVASSAFPGAFTPITLRNYPDEQCGYTRPKWVDSASEDLELSPQRYDRATVWRSYESAARPYIHLNDGGLADNIGLRGPFLGVETPAEPLGLIEKINHHAIKRLVFIVVDAKPAKDTHHDRCARPPGIAPVLISSATNPMENYSSDTVQWARSFVDDWLREQGDEIESAKACADLARAFCASSTSGRCYQQRRQACRERFNVELDENDDTNVLTPYHIHLRFELDADHADELGRIGTRFKLSPTDVRLLVDSGERTLWRSESFRELMGELNPGWQVPDSGGAVSAPRLR